MEWIILFGYTALIYWLYVRTGKLIQPVGQIVRNETPIEGTSVIILTSFATRRVGLLNHVALGDKQGLLLRPAKAVHTLGMQFPIDICFLDKSGDVLKVVENAPPGEARVVGPSRTAQVLELCAGASKTMGIAVHDKIAIVAGL
jgi:uncharacterized membrane protein (UPF0127 family)